MSVVARIVNLVGYLDFDTEFELSALADLLRSSEYVTQVKFDPAENHWLSTWFTLSTDSDDKDWYVSFYRKGSCAIVGCDSVEVLDELGNIIVKEVEPAIETNPTPIIKNVVATGDVGQALDLEIVAIGLGLEHTEYEPEQFPGILYRDKKHVYILFNSGKIVCTGSADVDSTLEAVEEFTMLLRTQFGET